MTTRRSLLFGVPALAVAGGLALENTAAAADSSTWVVDRYGQFLHQDWSGKVTADAQLQQEYAQESARLADVTLDLATYDKYGGVKALGHHGATGYFRVEKIDGRWWFVTPEGHLYFLKAVDAFSAEEWGYGTLYKNRDLFAELPDPERYPSAYAVVENGLETVSFLKTNLMRKYGDDYRPAWRDIAAKRFIDWGFNAQGKWHRDPAVPMPYLERAPTPPDVIKVLFGIDPFDPEFADKLHRTFNLYPYRNDPWLVGYFFENERGWDRNVVAEVLRRDSNLPAKQAFVRYLAEVYNDDLARVNTLLGTNAGSFRELTDIPIDVNRVPSTDFKGFITLASKTYYRTVRNAIQRQDPHHLFLGSSLVPTWRTTPEWTLGGVEYVDVLSFDVYSTSTDYLRQNGVADTPIINIEFCFMYPDRGLTAPSWAPVIAATSQAQRGEKYRTFLEAQAAHPTFVGSAWFAHYDQPVTRKPGSTETFNIGLVNQQDQPYHDMTDIMRQTNRTLEAVHLQAPPA